MTLNWTAHDFDTSIGARTAIARTRNNLPALADQLEAACADRDTYCQGVVDLLARVGSAEKAVTALTAERDEMKLERNDALDERDDMRLARDMQIKRGNEYADEVSRLVAERDSLQTALTKAKDEHTGDGLAWFEREHALTMERDALRARVTELESEQSQTFYKQLRAERDSLKARVAELETEVARYQQLDIDWASSIDCAMRLALLEVALRAILPVYEAAWLCPEAELPSGALVLAVRAARAAITPEIDDVLKQLEKP